MSADSPRHGRVGPLTVASQPPSDRTLIDTVSGFISDVTLASGTTADARDTILWARFETADINEPTPEGEREAELTPLLLILGYGSGVQVWLIPPNGEAQEVMSWRQGTVRALRILPAPIGADNFSSKRPLLALCDSAGPGPLYCSLSFISIRGGDQVKSIKFKNPILDVLANKKSVVISFSERFAVFDACTLEDRLAVTTCYPCPCPLGSANPINPLALGDRWLAYADKKLNPSKRSSGGCEGEGVTSYTATVLHAAKSLSKGLRGLGESVASSLAGGRALSQSPSPPNADHHNPGVVTILDIEGTREEDGADDSASDATVAHFPAHSDAVISLKFDTSGMLLVTADKRGHDFHVFRVHPHPCGPALAAVHHLYVLHRGDTTAKVQDISISLDSRWAAVSTLRGTTHVFPISPYGGPCGVRTHTQPRVVNRLSRFHRSAGLPIQAPNARSSSPVGDAVVQGAWFPNPRLPPYPLPATNPPLAQLRPTASAAGIPTHTITRNSSGRQRLSSLSEDAGAPLLACARWGSAPPVPPAPAAAHPPARSSAAQALYVMAATGHLLQYIINPRHSSSVAKEKVCDDTPIEVSVELVAQWPLCRPATSADVATPLPPNNPLVKSQPKSCSDVGVSEEERWLAQVEIVTHAGPHRRLWMGPQFLFKTYHSTLDGSLSSLEAEAVEVEVAGAGVARSPPVNMPGARPLVPVLIDSGSASSLEQSPSDGFRRKFILEAGGKPIVDKSLGDVQLREDLAEAMLETDEGPRCVDVSRRVSSLARAVDPSGTVVAPGADPTVHEECRDQFLLPNEDESRFRPVVRAPAPAPLRPDANARPLPDGTRIPVESRESCEPVTPDSTPLKSDVVIPVALSERREIYNMNATNVRYEVEENFCQKQDDLPRNDIITSYSDDIILEKCNVSNVIENQDMRIEHDNYEDAEENLSDKNVSEQCQKRKEYVAVTSNSLENDDLQPLRKKEKKSEMDSNPDNDLISSPNNDVPSEEDKNVTHNTVEKCENMCETTVIEKSQKKQNKGKNRERRSTTPRDIINKKSGELTIKLDPVESMSNLGESVSSELQLSDHRQTTKKATEKSVEVLHDIPMTEEIKKDVNLELEYVQYTVKLPSSKDLSSSAVGFFNQNDCLKTDDKLKLDEAVKLNNSFNNTEEQIWAILADDANESVAKQIKHITEDVKPKAKKGKKNKKMEVEILEHSNLQDKSVTSENKLNDFYISVLPSDELNHFSKDESSYRHLEEISSFAVENSYPAMREQSLISKEIKIDMDSEIMSTLQYDGATENNYCCRIDFKNDCDKSSRKSKDNSPTKSVTEIRKQSLEKFELPIDFDAYLVTNTNKNKNKVKDKKKSTESEDPIKEIFNDTMPSLNSNKSRKPAKDRTKTFEIQSQNHKCVEYLQSFTANIFSGDNNVIPQSEVAVIDTMMEELPSIGQAQKLCTKQWDTTNLHNSRRVMSYSGAVSKCNYEETYGMENKDILEPPKPCRFNLREKLAEICKRDDIAVAECGTPEGYYDDSSNEFELPPMEFMLDEFKLALMKDNFIEEDNIINPVSTISSDNIHDSENNTVGKNSVEESPKLKEESSKLSMRAEGQMEKSSDDDNNSPVTSQTDSDKDDKKTRFTDSTLPTTKPVSKKKSRQKRRK